MSITFESLDWKDLTLEPTSRPGSSSTHEPIMAAQLDDTTQVEIWGHYRTGALSLILIRDDRMPVMVTDIGYSAAHQEIAGVIDMQTWPPEFRGQQVIPREETTNGNQHLLDNWRRRIPYVGAHHLTLSAEEIKTAVIPRFIGAQQMSWEHNEMPNGYWDGKTSWTPAKDSPYLTVDMVLDIEQIRGHRVDAPQGGHPTEFIYSHTSPELVQHIMDTAVPQPVADTSPQATTKPLSSVAASLNRPNAQAIKQATVHQQGLRVPSPAPQQHNRTR